MSLSTTIAKVGFGRCRHSRQQQFAPICRHRRHSRAREIGRRSGFVAGGTATRTITGAYQNGQILMGPIWDPFGESTADIGDAWWRSLAQ